MDFKTAEVSLTVLIRGEQATRGSYDFLHKVTKEGSEVNALITRKAVTFNDCKKTVKLSNEFVKGALVDPPEDMKEHYRTKKFWMALPAAKRISYHVRSYVKALHPDNRGYTMEIL